MGDKEACSAVKTVDVSYLYCPDILSFQLRHYTNHCSDLFEVMQFIQSFEWLKKIQGDFLSYHLYLWEGLVIVAVNVILFYVIISKYVI